MSESFRFYYAPSGTYRDVLHCIKYAAHPLRLAELSCMLDPVQIRMLQILSAALVLAAPLTVFMINIGEEWSGPWKRLAIAAMIYVKVLFVCCLVTAAILTTKYLIGISDRTTRQDKPSPRCRTIDLAPAGRFHSTLQNAVLAVSPVLLVLPALTWACSSVVADSSYTYSNSSPTVLGQHPLVALGKLASGWQMLPIACAYVGVVVTLNIRRSSRLASLINASSLCLRCGYPLAGLVGTVCPECGTSPQQGER